MPSKILTQLQDFLCQPEVIVLYSSIHKLHHSKLEEALRIRGLSLEGDESTLRVRLLRFEVRFYYPEIRIPRHDGQISKDEASNLQMRVDALRDISWVLCVESSDAANKPDDARTRQTTQVNARDAEKSKTSANASITSDSSHNTENQVKYRLNCVKLLKVCNLQYSGARGLPAQDFLESLDDFRKFSKISDRVLLETLACVLDIDTKKWYRANNFADWQSFEQKFVEDHVRLSGNAKRLTADRGTQTDFSSFNGSPDETKKRFAVPSKKSVVVHLPVSRTLQDLKDSLSDIGFKTTDCMVTSKKSGVPTPVKAKIDVTTRQTVTPSLISKSHTKTTCSSTPQSPVNVAFKNISNHALAAARNRNQSKSQQSRQMMNSKDAFQSAINPQSNSVPSNNIIGGSEVPMITVNPAIRNFTNTKPNLVAVEQNNTPANYTTPISTTLSTSSNNAVTSVNQGQILYHPKAIDKVSQISSTNATTNGGCYLYARRDCNAPNLGQEYLTNQPLNYRFGTYHYPMDYYMPNGFGHSC